MFAGVALILFVAITVLFLYRWRTNAHRNPKHLPYPPGPRGMPFVGNIRDMPSNKDLEWKTYAEWGRKYGPVIHVNVLGTHIVILNSMKAASDLFGKRASKYSNRPPMTMLREIIGLQDWHIAFMDHDAKWKETRKAFHNSFQPSALEKLVPVQSMEVKEMLRRFYKNPKDWYLSIFHSSGAIITSIIYGEDLKHWSYKSIDRVQDILASFSALGAGGGRVLDLLPFLKYFPSSLPGLGFLKNGLEVRQVADAFMSEPLHLVKNAMAKGTYGRSVVADMLEQAPDSKTPDGDQKLTRDVAFSSYIAAMDSTTSTIYTFFLGIGMNPHIQEKARAELDAVVGRDRLPDLSDRPNLPYINAIVKETYRWEPAAPLALPHYASEDDEYEGYFIPKGTIVFGNTWQILHDEKDYPEPSQFRPERFLKNGKMNPDIQDPELAVWGFGRRICPGRFMADNSIFLTVASFLATFSIQPALDADGNPIKIEHVMASGGLVTKPLEFQCVVQPRDKRTEELICD